jgi:lipoprotein-anchoring transpeptidase ErfK/SrfK
MVMKIPSAFHLLFLFPVLLLTSGCFSRDSNSSNVPYLPGVRTGDNPLGKGPTEEETSLVMRKDRTSHWEGDGVSGPPSITIDLSQQRAYFYKGQTLVGVSQVSTGTDGFDTPDGDYKIIQKSPNHESNLYGEYKYPDGTVIQKEVDTTKHPKPPGAVFDGADMPYFMRFHNGIGLHGGYLPGFAASHGCVRMPINMAKIYFENVEKGTPVRVIH